MSDKFRSQPPEQNLPESAAKLAQIWMELSKVAPDIAHARRTIYNAYLAEGFTEAQALELIKQV